MNRVAKSVIMSKMKRAFSNDVVILVRCGSLNAEDVVVIKKKLWVGGVDFMLLRNSLAKIVVSELGFDFLLDSFCGTVVAFYSNDLFSLVKFVNQVNLDYVGFFQFLCGKYLSSKLSVELITKCLSVSDEKFLYVSLLLTILNPVKNSIKLFRKPILECSKCLKISVEKLL